MVSIAELLPSIPLNAPLHKVSFPFLPPMQSLTFQFEPGASVAELLAWTMQSKDYNSLKKKLASMNQSLILNEFSGVPKQSLQSAGVGGRQPALMDTLSGPQLMRADAEAGGCRWMTVTVMTRCHTHIYTMYLTL